MKEVFFRIVVVNGVAVHPLARRGIDDQALRDLGEVHVHVLLGRVEAVHLVVLEELVAEPASGGHVAVVGAVEDGGAEAPIDVIGLHRV